MKMKCLLAAIALFSVMFTTACTHDETMGDYDSADVGKLKKVVPGVIVSMRSVRLHNKAMETSKAVDSENDASLGRSHGIEYVVKLNSGSIISMVQAESIKLKVKQHVLVIYGRTTRIVPDNGSEHY